MMLFVVGGCSLGGDPGPSPAFPATGYQPCRVRGLQSITGFESKRDGEYLLYRSTCGLYEAVELKDRSTNPPAIIWRIEHADDSVPPAQPGAWLRVGDDLPGFKQTNLARPAATNGDFVLFVYSEDGIEAIYLDALPRLPAEHDETPKSPASR